MKKKRLFFILALVLTAAVFAAVGAYAAGSLGTQNDPLVTLSYLNERLYPQLVEKISEEADKAAEKYGKTLSGSGVDSYTVVTLTRGQKLVGDVGCEILLRVGTATVSCTDNPGLIDTTDASSLNNGTALTKNHLYMVTIAGGGISAGSDSVKVVVRGGYSIR